MKTINTLILGVAALAAFACSSIAGLQSEVDSSTNVLQALSTNTYSVTGDITGLYTNGATLVNPNNFLDCSKTTQAAFDVGGYFANTAAGASNVTFVVLQSVDTFKWSVATNVVVSVPGLTTNWQHTQFFISGAAPGLYPAYDLRQVQNPNTTVTTPSLNGTNSNVGSLFIKVNVKSGI